MHNDILSLGGHMPMMFTRDYISIADGSSQKQKSLFSGTRVLLLMWFANTDQVCKCAE